MCALVDNETQTEPKQRPVTYSDTVEPLLSREERLAEIGPALGEGIEVGPVVVPCPSLVSLALLECVDSPFVCPAREGEPDREVTRRQVIDALYIMLYPRESVGPVNRATRALAGMARAEKAAAKDPKLWEAYLDMLGITAAAGYESFDKAVLEWAAELPPVNTEDLCRAVSTMIALGTRGYDMIPKPSGDEKKKAEATSSGWSGFASRLLYYLPRLALLWIRRFTRRRSS